MNLVYKLLRCQLRGTQFAGFFLANLTGMLIVLLSIQLWYDLQPFLPEKTASSGKSFW